MENNQEIAFERLLDYCKEPFLAHTIYPSRELPPRNSKRGLTKKEKENILDYFFINFFNILITENRKSEIFPFLNKINIAQDNNTVGFALVNTNKIDFCKEVFFSISDIDSNIISNLISYYEVAYEKELLPQLKNFYQ